VHRRRNYRLRLELDDEDGKSREIAFWFAHTLMPAALRCPVDFAVEFVPPEDLPPDQPSS
jgi:hypothetical protein